MSSAGRPLRFLAVLLGGWICARGMTFIVPAWMEDDGVQVTAAAPVARLGVAERSVGREVERATPVSGGHREPVALAVNRPAPLVFPQLSSAIDRSRGEAGAGSDGWSEQSHESEHQQAPIADGRASVLGVAPARVASGGAANPWSGQAWMLWRPDAGGSRPLAPLLGGAQMGVRVDYRLAEARAGSVSVYGRASRAMVAPTAEEVAAGVALRPGKLPVSLLVERRQKIGPGGRSGFAAMVAGGLNPVEVAPRVVAEGYAQAGIVGLPGRDGFADGRASLGYRLSPARDQRPLMLGAAIAASAQPGARRIDVGPQLRVQVPTEMGGLRISAEWLVRIAGNARPANGPALTVMTDF